MATITLSTILTFKFLSDTFDVNVEPSIESQTKYRPSVDKEVTDTLIAMINSVFHTTNILLQQQIKKYKLFYRIMTVISSLIVFAFIIAVAVLEQNRRTDDTKYTEMRLSNLFFSITYLSLSSCLLVFIFLSLTYRRLYHTVRTQWRNECIRNLCQSTAVWAMQFPLIQFETKFPAFMYQTLLNQSKKKATKAFKEMTKKEKKAQKKQKNKMRSPVKSPRNLASMLSSPAKYDNLNGFDQQDDAKLNVCKMALCCCMLRSTSGFIRVFYKYQKGTNNDAVRYALNELQKRNCLIDETADALPSNFQIVQMIQQPQPVQCPPVPRHKRRKRKSVEAMQVVHVEEVELGEPGHTPHGDSDVDEE